MFPTSDFMMTFAAIKLGIYAVSILAIALTFVWLIVIVHRERAADRPMKSRPASLSAVDQAEAIVRTAYQRM